MSDLIMPMICKCGFSTISATEAIRHIKEKHPELWFGEQEDLYNGHKRCSCTEIEK